jgi:hypothetical protein
MDSRVDGVGTFLGRCLILRAPRAPAKSPIVKAITVHLVVRSSRYVSLGCARPGEDAEFAINELARAALWILA